MSQTKNLPRSRPRCSVYIAVSLDGYIARRDGSIDWLCVVATPGEDYGYQAFIETIDALVMGRKTYETALGFASWPYAQKRVVVVTSSPRESLHGETFHTGGSFESLLDELAKAGVRRVYVDGGALIRGFLGADLVDDVTLSIVPVLLGDGVSLFGGMERRLALVASRAFPSGLVQLEYEVPAATSSLQRGQ